MLFMDFTLNGTTLYQGQAVFGQKLIRDDVYLNFSGGLMFVDSLGLTDPDWQDLNTRYQLLYFDGGLPQVVPLQQAPVQNFAAILDNQNCVFGLYDQTIDTTLPVGHSLPVGADAGYIRQQFLA